MHAQYQIKDDAEEKFHCCDKHSAERALFHAVYFFHFVVYRVDSAHAHAPGKRHRPMREPAPEYFERRIAYCAYRKYRQYFFDLRHKKSPMLI